LPKPTLPPGSLLRGALGSEAVFPDAGFPAPILPLPVFGRYQMLPSAVLDLSPFCRCADGEFAAAFLADASRL